VNTAERENVRKHLRIPIDAKIVLCIAGFRPEKRHDLLLTSFASVLELEERSFLVLAGDGPTRSSAEELASRLGIDHRVNFVGQSDDVRGLVGASDVSVLASTAVETFSMAMLESMAMGVPLVATDMGGTREAVRTGETGVLVAPGDVSSLSQALVQVLTDNSLREQLGTNARDLVVERFSQDQMIRSTELLLLSDRAPKIGHRQL
jgi:glycosyltransferase involved in cell wall biosynthesis